MIIIIILIVTYMRIRTTVKPDLIATEMSAFPSKSSKNKNRNIMIP